MKIKSQTARIISRMAQTALLLAIIVGGGFLLPLFVAPSVFSFFSVTPLGSQPAHQVSFRIENRNADSGDRVRLVASAPDVSAHITAVRYSCAISGVELRYPTDSETYKKLPCGTDVYLPAQRSHTFSVSTDRSDVAYVPITVRVDAGRRSAEISSVIAASGIRTAEESRLSERMQVTVDQFGVPRQQ
jgi:hypothetical protein